MPGGPTMRKRCGVGLRCSFQQTEVAARLRRREKTPDSTIEWGKRRVHQVRFHRPVHFLIGREDAWVGLWSAKSNQQVRIRDFLERATIGNRASHVRFSAYRVGVEQHDVSRSEVRHPLRLCLGQQEAHRLHRPLRRCFRCECVKQVASLALFLRRVVPFRREARVLFGLRAEFRDEMFAGDEGKKAEAICPLRLVCLP